MIATTPRGIKTNHTIMLKGCFPQGTCFFLNSASRRLKIKNQGCLGKFRKTSLLCNGLITFPYRFARDVLFIKGQAVIQR